MSNNENIILPDNLNDLLEGKFREEAYRPLPSMISLVECKNVTVEPGIKHEGLNYVLHLEVLKPINLDDPQEAKSLIGAMTQGLIQIHFDSFGNVSNPKNGKLWVAMKAFTGKVYNADDRYDMKVLRGLRCYADIVRNEGKRHHINTVSHYYHISEIESI